jgi:hypothetical protein
MTQNLSKPKTPRLRGAKILVASLSIAATLSGWAWLTLNSAPVESDATGTFESNNAPAPLTLGGTTSQRLAAMSAPKIPDLSTLPVRGLRVVGDTPDTTAPPQFQQAAPREKNGGKQIAAPPQNSAPALAAKQPPEPKPRKTKSSR